MSSFTLIEGVYFATGAKRGAVYDTNSGKVYSVNETACRILQGKQSDSDFWRKLALIGLAIAEDKPKPQTWPKPKDPFALRFVWFEVNGSDCNQRCLHCYSDSSPFSSSYESPSLSFAPAKLVSNQRLTFLEWLGLIEKGCEMGVRKCQFIGGEPFLYRDEAGRGVLDLASRARERGYRFIEIFTNATMLDAEKIRRIKELGLNLAISLYSIREEVHDQITRAPGNFRKTIASLHLLKEAGIPTRVEMVVLRQNQHTVSQTLEWIEKMGFRHKHPDPLRPTGRGGNSSLAPDDATMIKYGLTMKPNFRASRSFLERSKVAHTCLAGKIVITENGDILPCIFSRNRVVGSVLQGKSLGEVITKNSLRAIWRTTKDDVLVCQDCEYRYACFDCRPLAEATASNKPNAFKAPSPRCTYNPYVGKWGDGVWKLDKRGRPYYDQINLKEKGGDEDEKTARSDD